MKLKRLSSRQREIIVKLMKAADFLTIKALSEQLEVSKRTVQRELKKLKQLLQDVDISLVSKPGVGISIEGEKELLNNLESLLETDSPPETLTPQQRRKSIIQEFLLGGRFHKLTALAYKFSVTEATISYDVKKVADWFEERGLSLNRKQGIGVELTGSETAFRRAVLDFLYQNVGEEEILDLIQDNLNKMQSKKTKISNKILNFIQMDSFSKLEEMVNEVLVKNNFDLVNSSYIGLMMHLALAVKRLQMGETIYIDQEKLIELKSIQEYKVAQQIADKLEKIFNISVPEEETGYITMHLKGAKLRKNLEITKAPLETEELEVIKLARILVKEVEKELDVRLSNDLDLISGLVTHLEPAMSRLKMGMEIRNPLLGHLQQEYQEVFLATRQAADKIANLIGEEVPEAEVGFLTMHIAAAVEEANQSQGKIRALVVCSSGIGSSKILATRLRKTIDRLKIVDEISAFSLKNNQTELKNNDIDLIISTIPLENYQEQTVVVSPILLAEEIEQIKKKMDEIESESWKHKQENSLTRQEETLETRLEMMATVSKDIINIIDNFVIVNLQQVGDYSEVINKICTTDFLPVEFKPELVKKDLISREEQGATIIPEIKLSLLHARTKGVDKPFLGLVVLDEPVAILDSRQNKREVDRIVVLLAPEELLPEERKLIVNFSASIIENDDFYQVVKEADKQEFIDYLRQVIRDYYQHLVKGGEK